jgi:peptide chain release factor 1
MEDFVSELLGYTEKMQNRYKELSVLIASPEIIAHNSYWRKLTDESRALEPVISGRGEIKKLALDIDACAAELSSARLDESLRREIEAEKAGLTGRLRAAAGELRAMLANGGASADATADSAALIDIKCAAGEGRRAELAFFLCKMYESLAKNNGYEFKADYIEAVDTGKINCASLIISGRGAYAKLKGEAGIHRLISSVNADVFVRIYRMPGEDGRGGTGNAKSAQGSSRASDGDGAVNEKDIRIDLFHSSGAGGQNINKVETAVRITHIPSGIVVVCRDERSQLKNKERALKTLAARLKDRAEKQKKAGLDEQRRGQNDIIKKGRVVRTYDLSGSIYDLKTGMSMSFDKALMGGIAEILDMRAIKKLQ